MPQSIEAALNPQQWEATRYVDGHELIIAGAGSGKTRVLTYKIAYLIRMRISPWNILALTFTNKAAREMNERIATVVGEEYLRGLWSGTFHSIFARILRLEAEYIGYRSDYTIYDAADAKSLVKTIVKEMALDDKVYKPSTICARISEAKNALVLPDDYQRNSETYKRDSRDGVARTGEIYAIYNQRLRMANAMDFDDLLLNTALLFRHHPEVCEKYANRFQYILVDEYQDTNAAQHRIISLLSRPTTRICAVGDDAQSIYGFRGANIDNILSFTEQFPGSRIFKLERNYRSTQTIVNAANSIIRHNAGQIPKEVYSQGDEGAPIRIYSSVSDKDEAGKVAGEIGRLHRREDVSYDEIALLYRTNAQSRPFEEAFRSMDIPYRIYGGLSFYQRKEVKDIIAYFRLVMNEDDEEAFKRIINYPARGIGATTVGKIQNAAAEQGLSLMQVARRPEESGVVLGAAALKKISAFVELVDAFTSKVAELSCYDLALHIVTEAGIMAEILSGKTAEDLSRKENVEELVNAIKAFEMERREETGEDLITLSDYLSQVSLLTDTDRSTEDEPKVTLMTVHAAKGLEFDAVFVTGMEENLFPCQSAAMFPREMEEERRLFYVAVTRAKRFCFLTYAQSRFRYGKMEFSMPSPFLKEIDERYVIDNAPLSRRDTTWSSVSTRSFASETKREAAARTRVTASSSTDRPSFTSPRLIPSHQATSRPKHSAKPDGNLRVGSVIEHSRFGRGRVLSIEGDGDGKKAQVDFGNVGTKNLLLRFAQYSIIE